ncbi:MAG: hypothetical protein E7589_00655 [Ruminococcaceae bacterium]|nr:hypothetical protein [Oscillospiraceae bacterium]
MLCEKCKKKKAVIYYTENLYGELRSFNLCTECADSMRMSGELEEFSAAISGLSSEVTEIPRALPSGLSSLSIPKYSPVRSDSGIKCPGCGIGLSEISESRLVGCVRCYSVFVDELSAAVDIMNFSSLGADRKYLGDPPRSHRVKLEMLEKISKLRGELAEAVSSENYELCATLRDRIRDMEKAFAIK